MDLINRVQRVFSVPNSSSSSNLNRSSKKKKELQGYLWKKNPAGIGQKRRWFMLNEFVLYYFENESSSSAKVSLHFETLEKKTNCTKKVANSPDPNVPLQTM